MGRQRSSNGASDHLAVARPQKKKPYKAPRLAEYGDLRKITMVAKGSNRGDGGGGIPATKR